MLYCVGTKTQPTNSILPTQNIIVSQLTAIFNRLVKQGDYAWKLYALAIGEEAVQEVLGARNNIEIR